jgi:predicted phosphodiesterase
MDLTKWLIAIGATFLTPLLVPSNSISKELPLVLRVADLHRRIYFRIYIFTFAATSLFPAGGSNWLSGPCWSLRNAMVIRPGYIILMLILLQTLSAIVAVISTSDDIYRQSAAIMAHDLFYSFGWVFEGFSVAQAAVCLWLVDFHLLTNWPTSMPGLFYPFAWLLIAALTVDLVPQLAIFVLFGLPFSSISYFVSITVYRILEPYLPRFLLHRKSSTLMLGSGHTVLHEYVPDLSQAGERTNLLLISDLHLAIPGEPVIDSSRTSESTVDFVTKLMRSNSHSAVLLAGDITDMGSPLAWERAIEIASCTESDVLVTPGNHDYHFRRLLARRLLARSLRARGPEDPMSFSRLNRLVAGDEDNSTSFSQSDVVKEVRLVSHTQAGQGDFPFCHRMDRIGGVVLVLDSNRLEVSTPLTNALGMVGDKQLAEAKRLVAQTRKQGDLLIVLLHHHVVAPQFTIGYAFLRCIDDTRVLEFAETNKADAIVHGHKHMPYVFLHPQPGGRNLFIISCGSAHHDAIGPFSKNVNGPSCYQLELAAGKIQAVRLIRRTDLMGQ